MKTGVLFMAHGTIDSVDDMEAYLKHVMKRPPTPAFIETMKDRYRQIGGRSPLTDITRAQARALSSKLGMPVYVGMRHWKPTIADAVAQAAQDGIGRLVGICAAPHYARISIGAYEVALHNALPPGMESAFVTSWHLEPALIQAWRKRIEPGVEVVYTAHSIPSADAEPYPTQLRETIEAIGHPGAFAYQSRSPSPIPWLAPDVDTKLGELRDAGIREVQIAPIGFISDHVEVLYDLDILHKATADKLGLRYRRLPMLNDDPLLIDALASAVGKA